MFVQNALPYHPPTGDDTVQFMFGDYVLDPERRELSHRAQVMPVGPQVFDLLLLSLIHISSPRD